MPEISSDNVSMRSAIDQYDWAATPLGSKGSWPQTLRTVLELALETPFPMLIMWGEELIQLYNDAFVPIFGEKHPRALGQRAQVCWSDIWSDVGPLLLGVYERGKSVFFENLPLMMKRHGGSERAYFTFSYSPIRRSDTIAGIICVVNETTAHVLREQETRERARTLAELDRAKTQFFNNVSHEFRTPLTLMLGPLEELTRTLPEYEHREAADLARRNAVRLQKLVNTLLDFSLVQSGVAGRRLEPVDIGLLTADLVSEFRSAFDRAGLFLDTRVERGSIVLTDRIAYEKIVLNLISNALKFTFEGGVRVEGTREGTEFVLRITDTGAGIDAADLPHLFERFRRVYVARSRTHEGSGIGLALVQELVSLLSGSIDVQSELGRGTTFTVRLPLGTISGESMRRAESEDTHLLRQGFREEAEALVRTPSQTPSDTRIDAPRIFVADDNADLRSYLFRALKPHYNVELCANGTDVLARLERGGRVDLFILDVMMPGLDGFECARRLRENPQTADVPVLFLSARAESVAEGLERGDEYIVKPFVAADLLMRVEHLLRRTRKSSDDTGERRDLVRERREHSLLAAAADRFIAAVDTPAVADAATSVLTAEFADWAALYGAEADGKLRAISIRHREAAKTELGVLISERYPYHRGDGSPVATVFETPRPLIFCKVAADAFTPGTGDAEHAAILASLTLRSALFVPVESDGTVVAVIAAVRAESPASYDRRDLRCLQRFAERTALALKSSRVYERERTIALTLQRAMLPGALPDVPGLRLSASYAPAAQEHLIGGDWYDAFTLADGRIYLSIGDVVGHGLDAATIMATLRQALRVLAQQAPGPARLLRQMNRLLVSQKLGRLATAIAAEFDPLARRLTIANAGHPYPVLVRAGGRLEVLQAQGIMLGVEHDADYEEKQAVLETGDAFALYTDGYVEQHDDAEAGEQALFAALKRARHLHDPAPRVHLDVLGSEAPRDDAALLILQAVESEPAVHLRIPATPEAANATRAVLRRFLAASGLDEGRQFEMLVAVGEAIINVVEHAYQGTAGEIEIEGTLDEREVAIVIEDFGRWSGGSDDRKQKPQRGYGLPLIHAFARVVSIEKNANGTRLRLSSRLSREPSRCAD